MNARGVWHQFGHNSQTIALDVLNEGVGVGVVISPRDLRLDPAEARCSEYRALGAQVLIDYQFYVPEHENAKSLTYEISNFRNSVNTLNEISQSELDALSRTIEGQNRRLGSAAVLAPAVLYEANCPGHHRLNGKLFEAAKRAGDALGVPTFATVGIPTSAIVAPRSISDALAHATNLPCDGWYYLFEFTDSRIPFELNEVLACGSACLTLATNLKPVIHAYAGPMALLSYGFGAAGAAVGHSQTLWQFDRGRWAVAPTANQGFPSRIAPRYFSSPLWGTVIYADEVVRIPIPLRNDLMTHTPFSQAIADPATHGSVDWSRRSADRHLVHVMGARTAELAALSSARAAAQAAIDHLLETDRLFARIAAVPVPLRPESQNRHQQTWRPALEQLLDERRDDYDLLELMG